jgi:hypothetical protein
MTPSLEQIAEWRKEFESKKIAYYTHMSHYRIGEYDIPHTEDEWQGYLRARTEQATEIAALKAQVVELLPLAKFGALIATNGTMNLANDAYESGVFKEPNFLCKHDNIEATITKLLKG